MSHFVTNLPSKNQSGTKWLKTISNCLPPPHVCTFCENMFVFGPPLGQQNFRRKSTQIKIFYFKTKLCYPFNMYKTNSKKVQHKLKSESKYFYHYLVNKLTLFQNKTFNEWINDTNKATLLYWSTLILVDLN